MKKMVDTTLEENILEPQKTTKRTSKTTKKVNEDTQKTSKSAKILTENIGTTTKTTKKTLIETDDTLETPKTTRTKKSSNTKSAPKIISDGSKYVCTLNLDKDMLELSTKESTFDVYVEPNEYIICLGSSDSYFSGTQKDLNIKFKKHDITVIQEDNLFKVSTTLDMEISENVKINSFEKNKDLLTFSTENTLKISSKEGRLFITNKEFCNDVFAKSTNISNSNNTLIISEEEQKVYLPYSIEEVTKDFNNSPDRYNSITDLIAKKYVLPFSLYKNPARARFREAYKLMRRKQHSTIPAALALAIELMFDSNLNPAIITACKNLDELDIYLDCLDDNELDKFTCFGIVYKSKPVVVA